MRFNWKNKIVMLFIGSMVVYSCTVTPIENDIIPDQPGFEGICFETEILPILVSRCGNAGCHNSIDKEDGIDLTNYEGVRKEVKPGDPGDSEIIEYMWETDPDEIMPPPPADPMPVDQIRLIEQWISDGAKNTVNCEPSECDLSGDISFSTKILPIIDRYCYGCHSTNDPQGGYSYSTHNETMKSVNDGTLMGSIRFESGFVAMPENSNKMPSCNIETIQTWIDQGAKDN